MTLRVVTHDHLLDASQHPLLCLESREHGRQLDLSCTRDGCLDLQRPELSERAWFEDVDGRRREPSVVEVIRKVFV